MSSSSKDGGQAFPVPLAPGPQGMLHAGEPGMSLRDWFAGQAIGAIVGNNQLLDDIAMLNPEAKMPASIAHHSYALADAMLAERSK